MTSSRISQERQERRDEMETLLTGAEVAEMFRVDAKTVCRWAKFGRIPARACVRTPGGHRRYKESYINALLEADVAGPLEADLAGLEP